MRSSILFLLLAACGSRPTTDASGGVDAVADLDGATADVASVDKSAACASVFGAELTNAFGRVDGTVLALVPPTNLTCPLPNATHLTLQLMMNGAVYRMVINVQSTGAESRVFLDQLDAPLAGSPWAEGWHPGAQLDYVATLGVTSAAFEPHAQAETVALISDQLQLGARVSVFATSSGGATANSAHLVHRNKPGADGAIVISPDTSPHYLLFRFSEQAF